MSKNKSPAETLYGVYRNGVDGEEVLVLDEDRMASNAIKSQQHTDSKLPGLPAKTTVPPEWFCMPYKWVSSDGDMNVELFSPYVVDLYKLSTMLGVTISTNNRDEHSESMLYFLGLSKALDNGVVDHADILLRKTKVYLKTGHAEVSNKLISMEKLELLDDNPLYINIRGIGAGQSDEMKDLFQKELDAYPLLGDHIKIDE